MADKKSMELTKAMELHPDYPVIYLCETDGVYDEYPSVCVEIKSVVVDRITCDIDSERMYLRDDDVDDLRDDPWSALMTADSGENDGND